MRLVDHHQIPGKSPDLLSLALGELIGTDDDFRRLKRPKLSLLHGGVVGLSLKDAAGKKEFFGKLLKPLLAKVGRGDDQDAPPAFGPFLRKDETGFDGFAQPNLVCQQGPF